jgi:alkanesulfonate monooxygenase SsuD/methylene tetrahydromethanopterin reductase-like flavin-dependent oxidoreductase (luciferase family)
MKFGLFDHFDANDRPVSRQYAERIDFVAAAERAGFYCYHVAEHHATPLNMAPVPGIFLGALAQATSKIRLGPLGYLLPLYSPLRLIEEICILDQMSEGRLDVGVGRGISPFELKYHHVDPATSRGLFSNSHGPLQRNPRSPGRKFFLYGCANGASAAAEAPSARMVSHNDP